MLRTTPFLALATLFASASARTLLANATGIQYGTIASGAKWQDTGYVGSCIFRILGLTSNHSVLVFSWRPEHCGQTAARVLSKSQIVMNWISFQIPILTSTPISFRPPVKESSSAARPMQLVCIIPDFANSFLLPMA